MSMFYYKVCVLTLPRRIPSLLHFSHVTGYAGHSVSRCCCRKNICFNKLSYRWRGEQFLNLSDIGLKSSGPQKLPHRSFYARGKLFNSGPLRNVSLQCKELSPGFIKRGSTYWTSANHLKHDDVPQIQLFKNWSKKVLICKYLQP